MNNNSSLKLGQRLKNIVHETTAGGIVYRFDSQGKIELLLIEDSKGRWTRPKGRVEPGETYKQTARREIGEEAGLTNLQVPVSERSSFGDCQPSPLCC